MSNLITVDQIKQAVPKQLKSSINQNIADIFNTLVKNDPIIAKQIKDNFITYNTVLTTGKYKMEDYLNAICYVTYKLMGLSNRDAYIKTFPNRYAKFKANNISLRDLDAYVSMYHKGKLVTSILEQSLIPTWLLNQDAYQEAVNTQVELMRTAKSEMVRATAANSLLTHLSRPEPKDNSLNININSSGSIIDDLKDSIVKLAKQQQELITKGVSTKEIAEQNIIEVKEEDING